MYNNNKTGCVTYFNFDFAAGSFNQILVELIVTNNTGSFAPILVVTDNKYGVPNLNYDKYGFLTFNPPITALDLKSNKIKAISLKD